MNLIEKFHALLVSKEVRIWHYHYAKGKQFEFQYPFDPTAPLEGEKVRCDTLEEMIHLAYAKIDPLLKPLPALEDHYCNPDKLA